MSDQLQGERRKLTARYEALVKMYVPIGLSRRREKLEVLFVVEGRRHPIGDASLIITYITIYIDNTYCIYSSLSLGDII
jgi:hypothetical protein